MAEIERAWKLVRRIIREADIVLEVLDARDPYATRCRKLEEYVRRIGKRLILVINKVDLIPKEVAEEWKRIFSREFPTIFISAKDRLGTRFLWRTIKLYAPKIPVKVAVVGYPNVGKSMIINILKGRHAAGTSSIPGYTKHAMLVKASRAIKVIDTPGVIPLDEGEEELIIKGALRPEALEDPIPPAIKLIRYILDRDPRTFEKIYGIESKDPDAILRELAKKRGLLKKGGELNIEEAARIIIRDWQTGKIKCYSKPEHYGLR